MIMSLIDYSKYKAQEANFKFWDELVEIIPKLKTVSFEL